MEFIAPKKNIMSNTQRDVVTSPTSIANNTNHTPPKGFSHLIVHTNSPSMAVQKENVLSHLQEDCSGNKADRKNKCFGKYYKNYDIKHLQNKKEIAELFQLNSKLFSDGKYHTLL